MIEIHNKSECCGCGACANVCPVQAITMKADDEGFLYPQVDRNICVNCGKCDAICPLCNDRLQKENPIKAYGFKHSDDAVRSKSSSGGAFTLLSDFILQQGGTVYGAVYDENFRVIHTRAENAEQRNKMRGSKYVQSDMGKTHLQIKKDLEDGKAVLFSGTPCQVSSIKRFIGENDRLITCDMICHGVPSPLIWKEFCGWMESEHKSTIQKVQIRDTENKWDEFITKIEFINGNTVKSKLFINLFASNNTLRSACHQCKFTTLNRDSDFTLADFWGVERKFPDFKDDLGVSYVLINTKKALALFENFRNCGTLAETASNDIVQPQLAHPTRASSVRKKFWRDYDKKGIGFVIRKYAVKKYGQRLKPTVYKIMKSMGILKLLKK